MDKVDHIKEQWRNEMGRAGYPLTEINTNENVARSIDNDHEGSPCILVA